MNGKGIGGHTLPGRGASVEWQTPPEILSALGPFDDDPCNAADLWDGLSREWRGFVWLNPPYGNAMWPWLEKAHEHGEDGGSVLALIFARTETKGFVKYVWQRAGGLLFLSGRLHFYRDGQRAVGNSGGPLVVVSYGEAAYHRLRRCRLDGFLVNAWTRTAALAAPSTVSLAGGPPSPDPVKAQRSSGGVSALGEGTA